MRPGAANFDLNLFAVGSGGTLQQFRAVEFLGGDRNDMPSQGAATAGPSRTLAVVFRAARREGRAIGRDIERASKRRPGRRLLF